MSENTLTDRPPKGGDRVHVEFDAVYVRDDNGDGGHLVSFDLPGYSEHWGAVPVDSVKVIVEPVKVGDVIDAVEAEDLPPASVVLCEINAYPYVRTIGKAGLWHGAVRLIASAGGPCRVLHLGVGAE